MKSHKKDAQNHLTWHRLPWKLISLIDASPPLSKLLIVIIQPVIKIDKEWAM